jgi:hypothetical protein
MKSLRHRRTISSRTPNASAMRGLRPVSQRRQHGTRAVRLAAITRAGKRRQRGTLVVGR